MIINISPDLSDKSYIQSLPGVINTVVSLDKEAVDRLTDIYQWNVAQVEPDEDLFLFNIIHDILEHSN